MTLKRIVLVAAILTASEGSAGALNSLTAVKVIATPSGAQVIVQGSESPKFTVFKLADPDRLIVDLSSADATGINGPQAGVGPVGGIVASQFSDAQSKVGRILVALGRPSRYDVRPEGNRLIISVDEETKTSATTAPGAPAPTSPPRLGPSKAQPAEHPAPEAKRRDVKHPAQNIVRLRFSRDVLKIETDGEVAQDEVVELQDPPRIVVDVYGVNLNARMPKVHSSLVKEIRAGAHPDKVRLVLDLRGSIPSHARRLTRRGLELTLRPVRGNRGPDAGAVANRASAAPEPLVDGEIEIDGQRLKVSETAPLPVKAPPQNRPKALVDVRDLIFHENAHGGRIDLKLTAPTSWKVEHPDEKSAVLTVESARLAKKLERSLDTSALETPVRMISAFSLPHPSERVRVVVSAASPFEESVSPTADGLSWQLKTKDLKTEEIVVNGKAAALQAEAAHEPPKEGAEAAASSDEDNEPQPVSRHSRYSGKRVSFEFKDIEIHNLLRLIAEVSKKNIVVADDVQGKVSIRLRNVPWDQALELILRSKGLGKEELGNIVRVAPLKTLEEESKLREERRKSQIRQEELVVQLIPVNYATATDMQPRVKDVLSERGNVAVDVRTNVLIVRDILSNIGRARSLVQNLDTQTPQVLIESRIVEANTTFSKQIGVQWGGAGQAAPGTGNPTGLTFPYSVAGRGGLAGTAPGLPDIPNFAVNLPAAVGQGSGGALGFVFGSAGGALSLNLRLSALENTGSVKTISAPKVTTLDHNTAKISQGVSIPFSQTSAGGVNTTFVEARLSLEVTPHVTQNGSVLMQIRAENNQPDPANTGANGQPAIQRKEANTQVLVKDGDTTVIGGIYVRRGSSSTALVPFFGKLPLIGFFFRSTTEGDNRQELLIFITPRIVNRQTIAQNL